MQQQHIEKNNNNISKLHSFQNLQKIPRLNVQFCGYGSNNSLNTGTGSWVKNVVRGSPFIRLEHLKGDPVSLL